jgi:2-methylfumaryl-CoA isomerase
MDDKLLHGLRVIEMSAFVAAPLGGLVLAQLGADVIRIDAPGGGVDARRWPVSPSGSSLFWSGLNQAKRSVTIDPAHPEGQALIGRLVIGGGDGGGILLTNLPQTGALSYEQLREARPDLIQLTIQGDRKGRSAVDYTVNCRVGLPYLTGPPGQTAPVNHVLPAWDLVTGQMAAVGLLAAERKRRLTSQGSHVKLALEDVALASMGQLGFLAEAQLGMQRQRHGNYLYGAFARDFVSRDGVRVMVVGLTLRQWQGLCAATEITGRVAELAGRLRLDFDLEGDRFAARHQISDLIDDWVNARDFAEIAERFERHRVCWGRYQTTSELVATDPSCSLDNPMFGLLEQPGIGPVLTPASALRFDERRLPPRHTPRIGQHTREVLGELLQLPSDVISDLERRGIVGGSA